MTSEEIKNKLQRGLALTVKESRDLYKYIESLEQQSCDDAVSRQALIDKATSWDAHFADSERAVSLTDIMSLPSVTPSRPKGHWISHKEHCEKLGVKPSGLGAYVWCSNCDCGIDVKEFHRIHYNLCPVCGADMQEAENEEGKNREFKILIKDAETYIKVTKQMDKEGIRWVSDGKFASNSEKYERIRNHFPIYLLIDKYNKLSWSRLDIIDTEYEITPEEYLKKY